MVVQFLLITALLASDEDIGLRARRNVSDILDLQRCYLWNPYSSKNEVSRSFHNYSLSPTHSEQTPHRPLFTPIINESLSSTSWTLPSYETTVGSPWVLPEPPSCAWPKSFQTPPIRPLFSSPAVPNETPKSLKEYAKSLPMSM